MRTYVVQCRNPKNVCKGSNFKEENRALPFQLLLLQSLILHLYLINRTDRVYLTYLPPVPQRQYIQSVPISLILQLYLINSIFRVYLTYPPPLPYKQYRQSLSHLSSTCTLQTVQTEFISLILQLFLTKQSVSTHTCTVQYISNSTANSTNGSIHYTVHTVY